MTNLPFTFRVRTHKVADLVSTDSICLWVVQKRVHTVKQFPYVVLGIRTSSVNEWYVLQTRISGFLVQDVDGYLR